MQLYPLSSIACTLGLVLALAQTTQAQISKPTEEELQAAPPQFQGLVHGRTDKIDQSKPPPPPGGAALPATPNPSKDPRDLRGYWMISGRGFSPDPGGGYPGGGVNSPATDPRTGDVVHISIDGNRMCLVALGVNPSPMKVYQTDQQLTMIYSNGLRARRVYFATTHTLHAKATYNGDSIAHWDGNTLVIDTIATKGAITLLGADLEKGVHMALLARPTLHVVERLTRSADGETLTDVQSWDDSSDKSKPPYQRSTKFTFSPEAPSYDWECEDVGDRFGPAYGGGVK